MEQLWCLWKSRFHPCAEAEKIETGHLNMEPASVWEIWQQRRQSIPRFIGTATGHRRHTPIEYWEMRNSYFAGRNSTTGKDRENVMEVKVEVSSERHLPLTRTFSQKIFWSNLTGYTQFQFWGKWALRNVGLNGWSSASQPWSTRSLLMAVQWDSYLQRKG